MTALLITLILLLVAIPLSVILWAMADTILDRRYVPEPRPYDTWTPIPQDLYPSEEDLFELWVGHRVDYARTEHDRARLIKIARQVSRGRNV